MATWLEEAIKSMPTQNAGGAPTATPDQQLEFHHAILRFLFILHLFIHLLE